MAKKMSKVTQGPEPKEDPPRPSKIPRREESGPRKNTENAEPDKDPDSGASGDDEESASVDDSNSYDGAFRRKKSPSPASAPCACNCGKCCCHSASSDPQHCVRCHANYTFNHSQACSVPHVFSSDDRFNSDEYPRDYIVRSMCCGSDVAGIETAKSYWSQAAPCFMGWHTTDVNAVKGLYNGLNVLHCDPGDDGKCRRTLMKHHAHYKHLYDDGVKYVEEDVQDKREYLKRKRDALGVHEFEEQFMHVDPEFEDYLEGDNEDSDQENSALGRDDSVGAKRMKLAGY